MSLMNLQPISNVKIIANKSYLVYDKNDGFAVAMACEYPFRPGNFWWRINVNTEYDLELSNVTHIGELPTNPCA